MHTTTYENGIATDSFGGEMRKREFTREEVEELVVLALEGSEDLPVMVERNSIKFDWQRDGIFLKVLSDNLTPTGKE